jgi:hypothetical protein
MVKLTGGDRLPDREKGGARLGLALRELGRGGCWAAGRREERERKKWAAGERKWARGKRKKEGERAWAAD